MADFLIKKLKLDKQMYSYTMTRNFISRVKYQTNIKHKTNVLVNRYSYMINKNCNIDDAVIDNKNVGFYLVSYATSCKL